MLACCKPWEPRAGPAIIGSDDAWDHRPPSDRRTRSTHRLSLAVAQVVGLPDDGPNQQGQPITLNCGPQVLSTIKTSVQGSFTNATNFTPLRGPRLQEVEVPDGATRCVKVLFTAETACEVSAANDFCYIRAVAEDANGVVHPCFALASPQLDISE